MSRAPAQLATQSDTAGASSQPGLFVEIRDTSGVATPARIPIKSRHALVGRAADAQVRLDRATVSRHHAEVLCDPFGRWWVRDLGSRNGVLYAGRRIAERPVRTGDTYQIGEFSLTFDLPAPSRDTSTSRDLRDSKAGAGAGGAGGATLQPNSTTWISVAETGSAGITTAGDLGSPRISASHLSLLMDLGRQMLEVDDQEGRLSLLCKLMVRDEFKGTCALCLRVPPDSPDHPLSLCPPENAPGWTGQVSNVSRNLLRAVRQSKVPALASNVLAGPNVVELSMSLQMAAVCAVACPLRAGGSEADPTDILYVTFPPQYGTGEWLAVAALAAEQFRLAESAWDARLRAQAHAMVERELEKAREIQFRLVPKDLAFPGLDATIGFFPCRWVGGDYVDAAIAPDGRVLLAVADVCGKGLPASLVAFSLHTLVHSGLRSGLPLADLMRGMNEHFCRHMSDYSFATMLAVLIDPATGELECVNMGHPPGLLIGKDGSVRSLQTAVNFPLGVCDDVPEGQRESLGEGELLAMFTDGLTETRTAEGQLLGAQRLGAELKNLYTGGEAATEVGTRLKELLDKLLGPRLPDDDRTFVLAKRV
jgi:serine phosphatase RsbU (regulator of sigma subunit)/pSer/pThr/pTyr-binding forkhead associated (FHA) protein